MHILICEDEHFIRRALAEHLAALEYQISEVENGLQCIEFVSKTKPDLILLDLKMPVMNGKETILRLEEMDAGIPIIVLSGFGISEEISQKYEHILKPYKLSDVSSLIQAKFSG